MVSPVPTTKRGFLFSRRFSLFSLVLMAALGRLQGVQAAVLRVPLRPTPPNTDQALLNNGNSIPAIGLGTYRARGRSLIEAVREALVIGYRHIDTAVMYGNHDDIAKGIERSQVPRKDIFITTKIPPEMQGYATSWRAIEGSLQELRTTYLDLCLVHFPGVNRPVEPRLAYELRKGSWHALQEAKQEGKCKHIGVSNYLVPHLQELETYTRNGELPAINQFESHPYHGNLELVQYCQERGIVVEAYGSLQILGDRQIQNIAKQVNSQYTEAQMLLIWGRQHGLVILPKSIRPRYLRENFMSVASADNEQPKLSPSTFKALNDLEGKGEGALYWDAKNVPTWSPREELL
eukprot:g54073.t1